MWRANFRVYLVSLQRAFSWTCNFFFPNFAYSFLVLFYFNFAHSLFFLLFSISNLPLLSMLCSKEESFIDDSLLSFFLFFIPTLALLVIFIFYFYIVPTTLLKREFLVWLFFSFNFAHSFLFSFLLCYKYFITAFSYPQMRLWHENSPAKPLIFLFHISSLLTAKLLALGMSNFKDKIHLRTLDCNDL